MKKIQLQTLFSRVGIVILLAGLTFAACDTVSENGNRGQVTLQFKTVTSTPGTGNMVTTSFDQSGDTLKIKGDNGTLVINDIRFIVDDFELESESGECESMEGKKEDDCEDFESELIFVDLPLNGKPLQLNTSSIKKGIYSSLEFEIDNLDFDEEEDKLEKQEKEALLAKVRKEFKQWPKSASMIIGGKFINNRGKAILYYTYVEAEISVGMKISPPLEVDGNAGNKLLTIKIKPVKWFKRSDGSVINLAAYSYPVDGDILKLEIGNGFEDTEVE